MAEKNFVVKIVLSTLNKETYSRIPEKNGTFVLSHSFDYWHENYANIVEDVQRALHNLIEKCNRSKAKIVVIMVTINVTATFKNKITPPSENVQEKIIKKLTENFKEHIDDKVLPLCEVSVQGEISHGMRFNISKFISTLCKNIGFTRVNISEKPYTIAKIQRLVRKRKGKDEDDDDNDDDKDDDKDDDNDDDDDDDNINRNNPDPIPADAGNAQNNPDFILVNPVNIQNNSDLNPDIQGDQGISQNNVDFMDFFDQQIVAQMFDVQLPSNTNVNDANSNQQNTFAANQIAIQQLETQQDVTPNTEPENLDGDLPLTNEFELLTIHPNMDFDARLHRAKKMFFRINDNATEADFYIAFNSFTSGNDIFLNKYDPFSSHNPLNGILVQTRRNTHQTSQSKYSNKGSKAERCKNDCTIS